MLELGGTFFRFSLAEMLYDMTFAQLLTMVETRNERELAAQDASEARRRTEAANPGYVEPPKGKNVPTVSEVARAFGPSPY